MEKSSPTLQQELFDILVAYGCNLVPDGEMFSPFSTEDCAKFFKALRTGTGVEACLTIIFNAELRVHKYLNALAWALAFIQAMIDGEPKLDKFVVGLARGFQQQTAMVFSYSQNKASFFETIVALSSSQRILRVLQAIGGVIMNEFSIRTPWIGKPDEVPPDQLVKSADGVAMFYPLDLRFLAGELALVTTSVHEYALLLNSGLQKAGKSLFTNIEPDIALVEQNARPLEVLLAR